MPKEYEKDKLEGTIEDFLQYINNDLDNPFILKGGTALAQCYGLDRFSEDIDLDAKSEKEMSFFETISDFCNTNGFDFREGKNTPSVQRAFVYYDNETNPLKIEVSYRNLDIPDDKICNRNGIQVYTINELTEQKATAYMQRDKIRDLYDVSFICDKYYDDLSSEAKSFLYHAFEYRDIEQFDYLVRTQDDPLIDKDRLEDMFLESFDRLGLLSPADSDIENTEEDLNASQDDDWDDWDYDSVD